jgi:hypothetical protein
MFSGSIMYSDILNLKKPRYYGTGTKLIITRFLITNFLTYKVPDATKFQM